MNGANVQARMRCALLRGLRVGSLEQPIGDDIVDRFAAAACAIRVLNEHSLDELARKRGCERFDREQTIRNAMRLASDVNSVLYALGPHPAMILRVMEAICSGRDGSAGLTRELGDTAHRLAREHEGSRFGLLWRVTEAACHRPLRLPFMPAVDPRLVAEESYWWHKAFDDGAAAALAGFLQGGVDLTTPTEPTQDGRRTRGVVLIAMQRGDLRDFRVPYGSMRIAVETAKRIAKAGYPVVLVGCMDCSLGVAEGLLYVGCENDIETLDRIRRFGPVDSVIAVSRGDAVANADAARVLIYQHGPHAVQGIRSPALVNRFRIPVVCLSQSSAREQIRLGVRPERVAHVYSGFDKRIFSATTMPREARRIVFAGDGVDYKGIDMAIEAFSMVRTEFPDATFHIYGSNRFDWRNWLLPEPSYLREAWLTADGRIDYSSVEGDLPGLEYKGEAEPGVLADAFRQASILIMPSRVAETFGLVSIEAQACGCIPVLPRNGAFPETMKEGETGYLYEGNTPQLLARRIVGLWSSGLPDEAQREKAVRWVGERFDWDRTGADVLRLLERQPRRPRIVRRLMRLHWYLDALTGLYGSPWKAVSHRMRRTRASVATRSKWRL